MGTPGGQQSQPAFAARTLNHVALEVHDLDRAVQFYQKLFGLPIRSSQVIGPRRVTAPGLMIGEGPQFIIFMEPTAFVPADRLAEADMSDRRQINHFCLGIAGFEPDGVVQALEARDLRAVRNMREGMRDDQIAEIGTIDPDRLFVQIQDESYCGGSGRLGQLCEAGVEYPETAADAPLEALMTVTRYKSVWLTVTDVSRSVEFYTGLFDVSAQESSGRTTLLMVGQDGAYLALTRGAEPGISRFSLEVTPFDPDEVMLALATGGVSGRRERTHDNRPAIEFTDPDGITVLLEG